MLQMIDYIQLSLCRQIYILRYFGEGGRKKCKKCDICTKTSMESAVRSDWKKLLTKLEQLSSDKGIEVDDLMLNFPFFEQEKYASMLQELYYNGELAVKGKRVRLIS